MAKTLTDLKLKDEPLPTAGQSLDDLPQFGGFPPPPQPGSYRFRLPSDLSSIWDVFTPDAAKGERVVAIFDQATPLFTVVSPGGKTNGQPFQTRLNNNERPRGKGGAGGTHSDFDYLLAAFDPAQPKPKSNREYIERIRQLAGREFGGDIRWSWRCSKDRNIRVVDLSGATQEVEGKKGCGEAYYQEDVDRQPNGEYSQQLRCKCGAILRAFANLDNIRG